jgi:hypothetical protein
MSDAYLDGVPGQSRAYARKAAARKRVEKTVEQTRAIEAKAGLLSREDFVRKVAAEAAGLRRRSIPRVPTLLDARGVPLPISQTDYWSVDDLYSQVDWSPEIKSVGKRGRKPGVRAKPGNVGRLRAEFSEKRVAIRAKVNESTVQRINRGNPVSEKRLQMVIEAINKLRGTNFSLKDLME